ncbi:hypothetical protein GWK47_003525 [Chionoecetes opilio]|uniref:C-type lectin domain-containing protein n=1 Tax=Chionoecetes opilio TaxID=41210 RepID=A0A8J4YVL3_CHIOP|nr:hypothetical protein GWK47_003525 [Chionoecetes opilio]
MLHVFCFLLGLVAAVHGACPEAFHQVGEGCYYFSHKHGMKMTWSLARDFCQTLGPEADLAVLDNLCNDYHHLSHYLIGEDIHTPIEAMYIGADGYGTSWFWIDSRALSPNSVYWFEANPTTAAGCVFMLPEKPHTYKKIFLSTGICTDTRYFICQNEIHARH